MSEPPDDTQAMPAFGGSAPILEGILNDVRGDLSRLVHHRRYHEPQDPASTYISPFPAVTVPPVTQATTPAPEAAVMALIATLENDAAELRAKVEEFVTSKLPAVTDDLKKLEGLKDNPVVLALLNAVHVPVEALGGPVAVLNELEKLYKPDTAIAAPSEPAAPAAPAEPVPAAG